MDRWTDNYQHFLSSNSWQSICNFTKHNDTGSITDPNKLTELARFEKVQDYLSTLFLTLEPQLVPVPLWAKLTVHSKICARELSNGFRGLKRANDALDEIVIEISRYRVSELSEELIASASKDFQEIKKKAKTIRAFYDKLFAEKGEEHTNLETRFNTFFQEVKSKHEEINTLFVKLRVDEHDEVSIETQISEAKDAIDENATFVEEKLKIFNDHLEQLVDYYETVFGKEDDYGPRSNGLKHEIELRRSELEEFRSELSTVIEELKAQIEALLPGATSVGLASTYSELKTKAATKEFVYQIFFGLSLFILLYAGLVTKNYFEPLPNLETWIEYLVINFSILTPIIWIAIYLSKRRSEQHRLEQEYAYKEALAKSFDSYKQQIEAIKQEDKTLLIQLLDVMIQATAKNPATTLDRNHGDALPVTEITRSLKDAFQKSPKK